MPYADPEREKEYHKKYRDAHKEEKVIYNKAYRLKNGKRLDAYNKEYYKKYLAEHPERRKESAAKSYRKHREKHLLRSKQYYYATQEYQKARRKRYLEKNRERIYASAKQNAHKYQPRITQKHRERYQTDIQYKLRCRLRTRLWNALDQNFKAGSAVRDLGCSIEELKFYLEGKFKDGMSWSNYGRGGWTIDHEIPLAYFDLTNREQFLKAFHYTNLQPLWEKENTSKGAKILTKQKPAITDGSLS